MKFRNKRILCWSMIVVLLTIFMLALNYNPMQKIELLPKDDDIALQLSYTDIVGTNSCEVDGDGNVSITGPDAYLIFAGLDNCEKTIAVELSEPAEHNFSAQIYVDYGNGFNENDAFVSSCNSGNKYICFNVRPEKYHQIRIDIDFPYSFKAVSMHENDVDVVLSSQKIDVWKLLLGFVSIVFILVILLWLNRKIKLDELIIKFVECNIKRIVRIIIACFVFVILYAVLPINKSVFIFGYAILMVLLSFVFNYKSIKEMPEVLFAEILFVVGIAMVLLQPYGLTCWDTDSHYRWALGNSSYNDIYTTNEDSKLLSNNMEFVTLMNTGDENAQKISAAKENGKYATGGFPNGFSLPHFFNGLTIAVLRLFNVNYYWVYVLGKIPSLLIYTLLSYFAMKRLKSGKMILATIALFPTCVFLASNYTYDYWVTGFSMLGMAYFVANCQEKDKYISDKDTFIIAVSMALACMPKLIYIGLLLIPFFMPTTKIKERKKFYLINTCILSCLFLMLIVKTFVQTTGVGDVRGGAGISPGNQILFILSNIGGYIVILLRFLFEYLSVSGMQQYISNFAYLGVASGYIVFVFLLMITTLFDKNEYDINSYSAKSRLYVVALWLGEAALIATAFYLVYTAVGTDTVLGCQPRYLVPLLYPLVSIICGKGIQLKINRFWFNGIVLVSCTVVLFYNIYNMMLVRVM